MFERTRTENARTFQYVQIYYTRSRHVIAIDQMLDRIVAVITITILQKVFDKARIVFHAKILLIFYRKKKSNAKIVTLKMNKR